MCCVFLLKCTRFNKVGTHLISKYYYFALLKGIYIYVILYSIFSRFWKPDQNLACQYDKLYDGLLEEDDFVYNM